MPELNIDKLVPHLFRIEFSKISAVLIKRFGLPLIDLAEDIASDTFLAALESWSFNGVPDNPTAWLYRVANNKALNLLKREKKQRSIDPIELDLMIISEPAIDLSPANIFDSQLRMLFALCHPSIPLESQVALALRILCGFGIEEIANAFLTSKDTINKRLFRAKSILRSIDGGLDFPDPSQLVGRLAAVQKTLYLFFNEGYYSETSTEILQESLCWEAMRLTELLLDHPSTKSPSTQALLALMCFHASRFPARRSIGGECLLYADQDANLWDLGLIARGAPLLRAASTGKNLSRYHIEAAIAYWHTISSDSMEKWRNIVRLYDHLSRFERSPVVTWNRIFAISKLKGKPAALLEAETIPPANNRFYLMLMGELYSETNPEKSKKHFEDALSIAISESERANLRRRTDRFKVK